MTLRTTPIQARSAARITELLDACAAVIEELGIEHVTTNLVAERAGCSIGTIYRYFPDRIAVLRALGLRQCAQIVTVTESRLAATTPDVEGFRGFLRELATDFLAWHRSAPGTSALGYAHLLDTIVREDESRIVDGRLRAGMAPRDQISREVARAFLPEGELQDHLKLDLDFATVLAVALADRAGAALRSGAELETDPYAWSGERLESIAQSLAYRFALMLRGEVPDAMCPDPSPALTAAIDADEAELEREATRREPDAATVR